jgi:hypothetical protein
VALNTIDERIQEVIAMKTDINGALHGELERIKQEA